MAEFVYEDIELPLPEGADEDAEAQVVTVTVEVTGSYHPATWGYHGGNPEEWPDSDVISVVDSNGNKLDVDILPDELRDELCSRAVTSYMEPDIDYDPPEDDY